jgi:hypothetical protein
MVVLGCSSQTSVIFRIQVFCDVMLCFGWEIPEIMKAHWSSDTLPTAHPVTQCDMAGDLNTQQHSCMNLTSCHCSLASFEVLTVVLLALQLFMSIISTVCYMQQNPKWCCYLRLALWHLFKALSLFWDVTLWTVGFQRFRTIYQPDSLDPPRCNQIAVKLTVYIVCFILATCQLSIGHWYKIHSKYCT